MGGTHEENAVGSQTPRASNLLELAPVARRTIPTPTPAYTTRVHAVLGAARKEPAKALDGPEQPRRTGHVCRGRRPCSLSSGTPAVHIQYLRVPPKLVRAPRRSPWHLVHQHLLTCRGEERRGHRRGLHPES